MNPIPLPPNPQHKVIWAYGGDAAFCLLLEQRIREAYIDRPVRYRAPVWWDGEYDPEAVLYCGFTNAGWEQISRQAWKLGRVGFRRFIGIWAWRDPETQRVQLRAYKPARTAPGARDEGEGADGSA